MASIGSVVFGGLGLREWAIVSVAGYLLIRGHLAVGSILILRGSFLTGRDSRGGGSACVAGHDQS